MSLFSADDETRISAAIADAEQRTSGEIVVVVAAQSDGYHYVPPLIGAIIALLVPWVLIYFTRLDLVAIYLVQLATFLIVTLALTPAPLRVALVPGNIKRMHAHRRAGEQFLAQNLHTTDGRTGVLLFVSVAEHYAEIIADRGIAAKVPEGTWKGIVDGLTRAIGDGRAADGFVAAIGAIGTTLAAHFPPGSYDPNELPDHLIILQ
ncbi:MAG: TPM domain-containing protein [Hyphomicrobium sp.]